MKKITKFLKKNLIRILFVCLLLPYLTSYIFVTKYLPEIKKANNTAIKYTNKAEEAYKAYGIYQNFDDILDEKKSQIKTASKQTENDVKSEIKKQISVENSVSILDSLFHKETPKELKNIEDNVKAKAKTNFNLNINLKDEIKKQPSHPIIINIKQKLTEGKAINYIVLMLYIPVFSVISIFIMLLSNILQITIKKFLTEKERVQLFNITFFWMTTFTISIIGAFTYLANKDLGIGILMFANIFYIYNCIKGIFGFRTKSCPACSQPISNI